ncbi:MAG: transporter substrate-binding domain-containing protein [Betaproteobacteria bacterium]|nr:transporter substrate-binding domain-containing protein [Betaproteobacteria bacterium]
MIRIAAAMMLFLASPVLYAQNAKPALEHIRDSKTITIGYRTDALPFAYADQAKQPAGYSVELCKRVAASIGRQIKVQPLAIKWVATTSQNRLELVRERQIDMECGSTTATLSRMAQVDFSSPIFVDTTGLLVRRASGVSTFAGVAGKKIAVVAGTTNQKALETAMKRQGVKATVVAMKNREEAVAALEAGSIDAFAGDKILLHGLARKVKDPAQYGVMEEDLGFEPYAIALPYGDAAMQLAVNRALSEIYTSGAIAEIFQAAFGPDTKPTPVLLVMYGIASYPE